MKRKALALLCAACLLCAVCAPTAASASDQVCFIALNERLLELTSSAYTQGGTVYVPYNVFDYFRIYYSYHSDSATASLYTATKQLYFELTSGNTYDAEGNYYSASALLRGGVVHVPVAFVCAEFGLSWSYIDGGEEGDVCRIKDGGERLNDQQFLDAASSLMSDYYEQYLRGTAPEDPGTDPDGPDAPVPGDSTIYLSFQGLPSDALLELLAREELRACFFLTAEELAAVPDAVRRITGEGHSVGALCSHDPEAEYGAFSDLLFEATHRATRLIASAGAAYDEACAAAAEALGLAFCRYDVDGVQGGAGLSYAALITSHLEYYPARADVRILCTEVSDRTLPSVLAFLEQGSYTVRAPSEVTAPGA